MSAWAQGAWGVVELPDGTRIRARGLRHGLPGGPTPDFGVYLLSSPPDDPGWPFEWIDCRDFRVPGDPDEALAALADAHRRARDERVEVACGGGVGRTGIALAVLAIRCGVAPADAVTWVRRRYHPRAVETPWQRRWVRRLDPGDPRLS